jgi:hypothetical protein
VVHAHLGVANALHARATGEATERAYGGPERRSFRKPWRTRWPLDSLRPPASPRRPRGPRLPPALPAPPSTLALPWR